MHFYFLVSVACLDNLKYYKTIVDQVNGLVAKIACVKIKNLVQDKNNNEGDSRGC